MLPAPCPQFSKVANLQTESNLPKLPHKKDEFLNKKQYLLSNRKSGIRFQK
jgi:hypothetical protein